MTPPTLFFGLLSRIAHGNGERKKGIVCLGQPGTVSTASTVACKVYQAVANLLRSEQSRAPGGRTGR